MLKAFSSITNFISALTSAATPLDGTEVLPIVQSGATVKVANNDLRPKQIQSNATSGVLQVAGPATAAIRVMTTPNANFTVARTDAAQTFTGAQLFTDIVTLNNGARVLYTNITPTFNSSATLFTGTNYGILQISDISQTGDSALFLISVASGVTELFDPANGYSITPGTVANANVTYSGGTITLENKLTIGASFTAIWLGI